MSPKKDKSVPQLVEKYKRLYPALERPVLRKMIRLENPLLFDPDKNLSCDSNEKKLDRYLRRAFVDCPEKEKVAEQGTRIGNVGNKPKGKTDLGFFAWHDRRAERKLSEQKFKAKESEKELKRLYNESASLLEEMNLSEDDPEYLEKAIEIKRKYGLL